MAFRYNDEMLIDERQRAQFDREYPEFSFYFDHPDLRADFDLHDAAAVRAKRFLRLLGVSVLIFTAISFIVALLSPWFALVSNFPGGRTVFQILAIVGGVLGSAAILIGNLGIALNSMKDRWLKHRFICERLRQWRFQHLLANIDQVATGALDAAARSAIVEKRETEYASFRMRFIDQIDAEFTLCATLDPSSPFNNEFRVDGAAAELFAWTGSAPLSETTSAQRAKLLEIYRRLRISGQAQYNAHKLSETGSFWARPVVQSKVLKLSSAALVFIGLLANIAALTGYASGFDSRVIATLGVVALISLILTVCVRSLEEGLLPDREIQRTRDYQRVVLDVQKDWAASKNDAERLEAARRLEDVAVVEMLDFLSSNRAARFIV